VEGPIYGHRYVGNTSKMKVHDLDNETTNCHIDEIITSRQVKLFYPDTLNEAHRLGYESGDCCLD
jgi:hypothetical protein